MLFHTWTFAAFLLAVLALHRAAPATARRYVLLVASYVFYGWWNPRYTLLILGSTLVDYVAATQIARSSIPRSRRAWLVASLATNLGILALFKYWNFFARSARDLFELQVPVHELLLPVGISFFTFQSMSYTIDVYRRELRPARDFIDFALFVSFFPQLVAGPIVRAVDFLPQLLAPRPRTAASIRSGVILVLVGLFKKMVVADNLAPFVDAVHAAPAAHGSADLWVSAYAFAFQIYADFSAYSDMAIGIARLLGYELPENFRRPYMARNPSEFWRRWHISLSTWLRDYLFIPLGGSRGSGPRTARNLMITMVLGGLWHGANWTFVVWGLLHGLLLVAHRGLRRAARRSAPLARMLSSRALLPVAVLVTFHGWVVSMVFFRAASLGVATDMLWRMASPTTATAPLAPGAIAVLAVCGAMYAAHLAGERVDLLASFDLLPLPLRVAILVVGTWLAILYTPTTATAFIYFQF